MPVAKNTTYFGSIGENLALSHLKSKGYKIIKRNFRSKFGEIDIIAQKDSSLIFVEVKTRWSKKYGDPKEAVNEAKIRRISRTAEYFSLLNPNLPKKLRIEVVAIDLTENSNQKIQIISVF